jgi:YVTN family beta-propeller protein
MALSPDGALAYVTNSDLNAASVIDTSTNTVASTIPIAAAYYVAASATGPTVFVSGFLKTEVSAIDIATGKVVASVSVSGNTSGLAVSPDGSLLYINFVNPGGSGVSVVNTSTYTVVSTIFGSLSDRPGPMGISPDGAFRYVSSLINSTLSVFSTADNSLVNKITVPGGVGTIAFGPLSNAVIAPALVTLHPASVAGGTSATGYVVLNGAAPAGGATASLSSDDSSVIVPASVTVPAGGKTASFNVTTQPVGASKSVNISAVYNTLSKSAVLTVIPTVSVSVSSVSVNPTAVVNGDSTTGTVTLTVPAPAGGVTVDLWTNGSPAFVPATVTIPAGSATATFPVTTNFVATATVGTITAFSNGTSATTTVTVTPLPSVASVSVLPTTIPNTDSAVGTVTLSGPAPTGGTVVQLWTNGSPVFVPTSVAIPAGSTSATFAVTTSYVATTTQGTITAFLNGKSVTTTVTVSAPITVASLSVTPSIIASSSRAGVALNFSSRVPAGGVVVQFWTDSGLLSVPASLNVDGGALGIGFQVTAGYVSTPTQGTITAFLNGQSISATYTVAPVALTSVSVITPTVLGGLTGQGTVNLAAPAPTGGVVVQLWTNGSPAYVQQTSITIPAGSTVGYFDLQTDIVASPQVSTITAFLNGQSVTTTLSVVPPIALVSVSVSPASVPASGSATGTVKLNQQIPATAGGVLVWLWTNGSPAFVPNAVIVPPGSDTITFPVTTNYVATPTQGTITAFYNGQSVTTTITVTP